jgi:hypothetical protein
MLKSSFPDDVHKRLPEFLADRYLLTPDKDVVVPDAVHPCDVDDVGVMHAGKGGG